MGPFNSTVKRPLCLRRDFTPSLSTVRLKEEFARLPHCETTFVGFDWKVQQGVFDGRLIVERAGTHTAGHLSVGGEAGQMSDVYASPGDPLFYLHHASIDHEWWKWQYADPEVRLLEATGPALKGYMPFGNLTGGTNITLDFEIGLNEEAPMVPLSKIMDTHGDLLCYTYAKEKAVYVPETGEWVAEELTEYDEDLGRFCGGSGN